MYYELNNIVAPRHGILAQGGLLYKQRIPPFCDETRTHGFRMEPESHKPIDAEKLFIDSEVQRLLTALTGMDLEGKVCLRKTSVANGRLILPFLLVQVFRTRRTRIQQRSHYALMTDERLAEVLTIPQLTR